MGDAFFYYQNLMRDNLKKFIMLFYNNINSLIIKG